MKGKRGLTSRDRKQADCIGRRPSLQLRSDREGESTRTHGFLAEIKDHHLLTKRIEEKEHTWRGNFGVGH